MDARGILDNKLNNIKEKKCIFNVKHDVEKKRPYLHYEENGKLLYNL